MIDEKLADNI